MRPIVLIIGLTVMVFTGLPATRAQQRVMPVVGFVRSTSLAASMNLVNAFRQGLREAGFAEGKDVRIEYRAADNHRERLPSIMAELIDLPVLLIAGNAPSARAAKAATTALPIVFVTGSDPVKDRLVKSLGRPGGNVTGVVFVASALGTKRLGLLRQLVSRSTTIAMLANPQSLTFKQEQTEVLLAAQTMGQNLLIVDVGSIQEIETAFATFARHRVGALLVGSGPLFFSNRERLIDLAARYSMPAMYVQSEIAKAGGLMSYGANINEAYRQAGIYAGRILNGEKPYDLPVIRSTKFELVINLKTAKALRLTVPPSILLQATEVVE